MNQQSLHIFMIVVIALSNMNYEKQYFNTGFNGFKADTSNSWIKWVALAGHITNMTLSSTDFSKHLIIVMTATSTIDQDKQARNRIRDRVSKEFNTA